MIAVVGRPIGFRLPRGEALQERVGVKRFFLTIDPTKSDGFDNAVGPRHRWRARARFEDPHPELSRRTMVLLKPSAKLGCILKCQREVQSFYGHSQLRQERTLI